MSDTGLERLRQLWRGCHEDDTESKPVSYRTVQTAPWGAQQALEGASHALEEQCTQSPVKKSRQAPLSQTPRWCCTITPARPGGSFLSPPGVNEHLQTPLALFTLPPYQSVDLLPMEQEPETQKNAVRKRVFVILIIIIFPFHFLQ